MTIMPVTLTAAGILGLFYLYLSLRVTLARRDSKISIGEGATGDVALGKEAEASKLAVACRAHGNFSEYVPLALVLMGGIEMAGASHWLMVLLALLLIGGRVAHPVGMNRPAPNAYRGGGIVATWLVIALASLDAIRIGL